MNDDSAIIPIIAGIIIVLVFLANIWLYFFAPCNITKFLPVKDVPARCLNISK